MGTGTSERLAEVYAAFNRRDIAALMAAMTADVLWPNGWEGGTIRGRDAVTDYWRRQWGEIDPTVVPTAYEAEADGRTAVTVHQVVRDRSGGVISDHTVMHLYRFEGDLVAEMEIRDVLGASE
ncbi:nuclear transport factor 2 family protein [Dactylosporangium darangshiense]|uniref:SnoaL-like domain-containing protein n=1 Tax=Dactylosporangium darangshiense TaxID=579108 RepID=A0ABP8DI36_9ACTN